MRTTSLLAGSLVLALGLGSCGGGGGGGGGSTATTAEFLVSSIGEAELFALSADVTELRLRREDGSTTANLLAAPVTLEFVGMEDVAEWLTKVDVPAGTYTAVEVEFDSDSVQATSEAGSEATLSMPDESWQMEFDEPLVVAKGDSDRMELVLDLTESVQGDVIFPAPPQFLPAGDVFILEVGDGDRGVDEVVGLVVEVSLPDSTFGIEVFRDEMMEHPMGVLTVFVGPDTVLVDDNDLEFPNAEAFFASLRVGLTVVEVHGALDDTGVFQAERVEIEDQGGQRPPVVEMEGMILFIFDEVPSTSPRAEGQFVMLIREIEEGADIAEPVLEGIGNPSAIDVIWDAGTAFVGPGGEAISPDQLRVGQIIDVAFDEFVEPPFLASEIELDRRDICVEGIITEVDGESGEIVIRLDDDDFDRHDDDMYGDDEHDDYDEDLDDDPDDRDREITVELADAAICLGIRSRPSLEVGDLVTGMKIGVCGTIERRPGDMEGDPDVPVLVGSSAKLKPGHLIKGVPGEVDAETCSFTLEDGKVVQTFGDLVTSDTPYVLVDEDAEWRNDAGSKEEFLELFDTLEGDEYLDVKIKGIGSGEPDEIVAYELKVKVRRENGNDGDGDHDGDGDGDGEHDEESD